MAIAGSRSEGSKADPFVVTPSNAVKNPTGVTEGVVTIAKLPEKTNVVDTAYQPRAHLLSHVEGSNWTVNYYRQLLGINDEAKPLQIGTNAVHQTYELFEGFNLKVTSPYTQAQDSEHKEFTITGEGIVLYGVIANFGDMFTADIADGNTGLFTVTESERMAYTKAACYRITYTLVNILSDKYINDLEQKTLRTYVYSRELLESLGTPFLLKEDYAKTEELKSSLALLKAYMEPFWDQDLQTLGVPFPGRYILDPYHADYCRYIGILENRKYIKEYQTNGKWKVSDHVTLWTLLKEMSLNKRTSGLLKNNFTAVDTYNFKRYPVLRGVGWSKFKAIVLPKDFNLGTGYFIPADHQTQLPGIVPLLTNNSYVFSTAYYENQPKDSWSILERLTEDMLEAKNIDLTQLNILLSNIDKLNAIEKFYFIPIYYSIVNYASRTIGWN